ncbi:hypothetical protein MUO14_08085 [Halobacillus shinanisalinarum]|uniref:Uncharacterized protein n=1 Tax=Halobacillus shinanisalinarum TaxID=2932258 RepID=A0ABY4H428_9BACI|nr:hypothetical protein [Halobacillus shinanisalinarum]UOQ94874.1 hypothetical protein MUO14_08085 [Halobacillus shinanisalinarum]
MRNGDAFRVQLQTVLNQLEEIYQKQPTPMLELIISRYQQANDRIENNYFETLTKEMFSIQGSVRAYLDSHSDYMNPVLGECIKLRKCLENFLMKSGGNQIKGQVERVIELVTEKKKQADHKFLDTLLNILQDLLAAINANKVDDIRKNPRINGALRAYFDTILVESYGEPLVIELDNLETMLNKVLREYGNKSFIK